MTQVKSQASRRVLIRVIALQLVHACGVRPRGKMPDDFLFEAVCVQVIVEHS